MTNPLYDSYLYHRARRDTRKPAFAIAAARDDAAAGRTRYKPRMRPFPAGSWQAAGEVHRWRPKERAFYCDTFESAGLRNAGRADDVARAEGRYRAIDHSGWFTRDDGDDGETISGYVLRLPHGRMMPGIAWSACDGVTLYPLDSYDDAMECAYAADDYARCAAECERDYNRAWDAGSRAAYENESAGEVRRRIIQVCADLRAARREVSAPYGDAIARLCELARGEVQSLLDQLARHRRKRDKLAREFDCGESAAAFRDGYAI